MSRHGKAEAILGRANALEKEYNWIEAAELHKQALCMVGKEDFLRRGEIQERIGYCLHRAAMQAENQEEFKERAGQAIEACQKASGSYEKLTDKQKTARMSRCQAVAKYLGYWLTSDPAEKRKFLDECLELEGKALAGFLEAGDMLEYGRTYSGLPLVFWLRRPLEWDRQTLKRILEKGLKWGNKALTALSKLGNSYEIAKAYLTLSTCLTNFGVHFIADLEEHEKKRLENVKYLSEAVELSERVGDAYVLGLAHLWWGMNTPRVEERESHCEKVLEYGKQVRDNFLIGSGLDYLAHEIVWKAMTLEDPDQRRELVEKAVEFCDEAQRHYSLISFISPRRVGAINLLTSRTVYYYSLAEWETDPEKRLEFLKKAEKAGIEALKAAPKTDMPLVIAGVLHEASKTLTEHARSEPHLTEKRSRLQKALEYREKTTEIWEMLQPFDYWLQGVSQNYLGEIKAELADIEPDLDKKIKLLEEAVLSKEKCLKLTSKHVSYLQVHAFAALHRYQDTYIKLLTQLYDLTDNPEHLKRAIEISHSAVDSASKLGMVSLMAISHWKIAKAQDILREHLKAAGNFRNASENYEKAAQKIPQLKDFYQDYASYMQAWSEIEKAKHRHAEKQYGQAKDHYEKAANLHKSTDRWNHLSLNYLAWARLEEAEDLSRKEQTEEARNLFQQAVDLFEEVKESIEGKLEKIETRDDRQMAAELNKISDTRRDYCLGRTALEEAKILDRQGNHAASSKKYGEAAERFQMAIDSMEYESDRQELKPILVLSKAWQIMTRAEAEASPDLYLEASKLFEEAKEYSRDEKAKVLALGHSRFCKALEAGAKFGDTRDLTLHSAATRHLESASSYYVKAGFKSASEYARATHRLFDAYMYVHKAETETEPRKKAQYYRMAERFLQASAGSYTKAKHPEKSEEVQRLLENVREEQQLAMSLTEVLHVPTDTSTTTSFSTPTQTYEQAVGLERFEHADVQANLILRMKTANVGEDVGFRIELVNVGKAPALLIKVDEITPESFEIREVPEICRIEDRYLDLKGRRLNPLKTVDIRLTVKPTSKGVFSIKPRILYIDETGKYKSHEPEPLTITVKELGIKGWIKGES